MEPTDERKEEIGEERVRSCPVRGNWIIGMEVGSDGNWTRLHIIQRVSKSTKKKNRFFNVQNKDGSMGYININDMHWSLIDKPEGFKSLKIIPPLSFKGKRKSKKRIQKVKT